MKVSRFLLLGTSAGALAKTSFVAFVLGAPLWLLIRCGVVDGVLACVSADGFETTFGTHVPEAVRSRVGSVEMALSCMAIAASQLAVAPLAHHYGLVPVIIVAVVLHMSLGALPVLSRSVRTITVR